MDEWRGVPNWEGCYEVSSAGCVRSVEREVAFSDGRVRRFPSVVRATYPDTFGYAKVTLKQGARQERVLIHHLVAAAWHGPRPAGMVVCHGDGNRTNNSAANLRYDTTAGNRADSVSHGTAIRPTMRKFTDEQVAAIRDLRGRLPLAGVATQFGVSKTHVCNIQLGNRRKG